jgi:NCS1 family nucleobase:cation symporter-1
MSPVFPKVSKLTTSINTYIGASCMLIMLEAIWPSLIDLPNTIPGNVGVTSNRMIAYFVFWTRESSYL